MLMPKRVKYRRMHRGNMRGAASRGNTIAFGQFALQALDRKSTRLNSSHSQQSRMPSSA